MHWAIVLAGGSGTRFWPLSTPTRPKHLLPLVGGTPSAVSTLAALEPLIPRERVLVVTGADLAPRLADAVGLNGSNLLIEPRAASTAPALVWASVEAARRDPEAVVLSMHADWHLDDGSAFRHTATLALEAAHNLDALVTVGIVPTRVEPALGYIMPGERAAEGVRSVHRFVEKPDAKLAEQLIAEGALWNSGLFAWRAGRLLDEVREHCPEVAGALPRLEAGDVDGFFAAVRPVSIDVGVFERSKRVVTLKGEFPWDDIGTWAALARVRPRDGAGNVTQGPVHSVESKNCVAWSDSLPVVLSGVEDLVVVCANGRVLVMPRERAGALKDTLEALPPEVRNLE